MSMMNTLASCRTMNKRPLFSIIIPIFENTVSNLAGILSILYQENPSWEAIYGFDTDNADCQYELELFAERDTRIKPYLDSQHESIGELLNNCVEQAKGRFIIILHAEDDICADMLAKLGRHIRDLPRFDICYSIFRNDTEPELYCNQIETKITEAGSYINPAETWYYLFKRRIINNRKLRFQHTNSPELLAQFSHSYAQYIKEFAIYWSDHPSQFSPFAYPPAMALENENKQRKPQSS